MKFLLDTDKVSGVSDSIANCVKGAQNVLDSVNGYDVSCDDFDFAGAKAKIASNVSAFVTRIQNTSAAINGVIECHTALQNIDLDAKVEDEKKKKEGSTPDSSSPSSGSPYRGTPSYSPSYTHAFHVDKKKKTEKDELESKIKVVEEKDTKKEYKPEIKGVSYAIVNKEKTTAESKKVLDKVTTTDANGYMMIGNRYVIACDESIGKVGDVIRFTSSDNKVVECVVAITTVAAANKGKVFVLVDDKQTEIKAAGFADTISAKDTTIENVSNKQKFTPQKEEEENSVIGGKVKEGLSNATNEQDSDSNKSQEGKESSVVEEKVKETIENSTDIQESDSNKTLDDSTKEQESDSNKAQEDENMNTDEKKPDASELFENGDGINA